MDALLFSISDTFDKVVSWGIINPEAGLFLASLVVNLVYKLLPASGFGRDMIDIAIDAVKKAYTKKGGKF